MWLIKLLLAHLLTDFIFQPKTWIKNRQKKHFASAQLYLHGFITAVVAWMFIGWQYWIVASIIFATHILIDGWKSYQEETISYFLVDQFFHIMIIIGCWYYIFIQWSNVQLTLIKLNEEARFLKTLTAAVFLTAPAGILVSKLTNQWRVQIKDAESLASAGKWIGITERLLVMIFVMHGQYEAIGLLIAAKGIIRFGEKDRPEIKTEYLVIGTLISIGLAVVTSLSINL
jgi:hypothetical protein